MVSVDTKNNQIQRTQDLVIVFVPWSIPDTRLVMYTDRETEMTHNEAIMFIYIVYTCIICLCYALQVHQH